MFKKRIDIMSLIGNSNIFAGEAVTVTLDNNTSRIGIFIKEALNGIYLFEDHSSTESGLRLDITFIPGNKILFISFGSFGQSRDSFLQIVNEHFGTELK